MAFFQQWDPELARVAQKWADQCADVDYQGDFKRKDPLLFHDQHSKRKIGESKHLQILIIKQQKCILAVDWPIPCT